MKTNSTPQVAIIMGSDSDWPTLKPAAEACAESLPMMMAT